MSRTDKTRPYWVKVNDEGTVEHNHHTSRWGGRARYRTEKVLDAEGNPVMENHEVWRTAKSVLQTEPRMKSVPFTTEGPKWNLSGDKSYTTFSWVSTKLANPVYSEAEHLVALGMPNELVLVRTDRREKVERTLIKEATGNGCDYEEGRILKQRDLWRNNCTPTLPWWKSGYGHCTCCTPHADHESQRAHTRDATKRMVKAYNSGDDDWEDDFDHEYLTPRRRYSRSRW
jgi:hypothetical protein